MDFDEISTLVFFRLCKMTPRCLTADSLFIFWPHLIQARVLNMGGSRTGVYSAMMIKEWFSETLSPTQTISLHPTLILEGKKSDGSLNFPIVEHVICLPGVAKGWIPWFSKRRVKFSGSSDWSYLAGETEIAWWWVITPGWGRSRETGRNK